MSTDTDEDDALAMAPWLLADPFEVGLEPLEWRI